MVTRTASKTAARRPVASTAKKAAPAPARRAVAAKPAPAAKKAAPVRKAAPTPEPKQDRMAPARAARAAKESAAIAKHPQHPLKKAAPTAHDVARAYRTARAVEDAYWAAYGDDLDDAAEFVAPVGSVRHGRPEKDGPARKVAVAEEDRVNDEFYDRDKTENLSLRDLRELAADLVERRVITEKVKKLVILEQMEKAGLFRYEGDADSDEDADVEVSDEDAEEDEEDDADDEEADDEEESEDDGDLVEENYTRADLKKMTLDDLQDLAEANEVEWEGLDKADLIDALMEGDEEEEEESEEEDGEYIAIVPAELKTMDLDELLALSGQIEGLKIPASKKKNRTAIIDLILEKLNEEEAEEE